MIRVFQLRVAVLSNFHFTAVDVELIGQHDSVPAFGQWAMHGILDSSPFRTCSRLRENRRH